MFFNCDILVRTITPVCDIGARHYYCDFFFFIAATYYNRGSYQKVDMKINFQESVANSRDPDALGNGTTVATNVLIVCEPRNLNAITAFALHSRDGISHVLRAFANDPKAQYTSA